MTIRFLLVTACLFVAAGCSHYAQTTSGAAYLENFEPVASDAAFDQKLREAAAVEPLLQFPARIGVARIAMGELTGIPREEAAAWADLAEKYGETLGEVVPVNLLLTEMMSQPAPKDMRETSRRRAVIEKLRLAAARQHLDAVLIYEVAAASDSKRNALAFADVSLIGAFILPGRKVAATGYATALLVDVRNGYPYGTATAIEDKSGAATTIGQFDKAREKRDEAMSAAVVNLAGEVDAMLAELMAKLPDEDRRG